jgi:hypothetical protein
VGVPGGISLRLIRRQEAVGFIVALSFPDPSIYYSYQKVFKFFLYCTEPLKMSILGTLCGRHGDQDEKSNSSQEKILAALFYGVTSLLVIITG